MKTFHVEANTGSNREFVHDLTITSKKKKDGTIVHKLFHSYHKSWNDHIRGVLIMKVIDTGDDLRFESNCNYNELGYDEAEYLFVMLKHLMRFGTTSKLKHKIIEK